jgi:glycosyltransferase involved in cell wall biosynthesis
MLDPAVAVLAAVGLTLLAAVLRVGSVVRRHRGGPPRSLWGPTPLINIRYASEALRRAGYTSTTLVSTVYSSYRREDFDLHVDDLAPRWRSPRLRDYVVFAWTLLHADVHVSFFDGGYLQNTRLRDLEGWLLRLAGRRLVVMPFGGDIAVRGYLGRLEAGFVEHYPHVLAAGEATRRRVTWYCRWADVVIRNLQPGFLPRADFFWASALVIDADVWASDEPPSRATAANAEVVVLHAPNHRALKGTSAVIAAVEQLREEGLHVRLMLMEGQSNEAIRRALGQADVVIDQIVTGFGLFAVEAMSVGRPVISNLSWLPDDIRALPGLVDSPLVDASESDVVDVLRTLVTDPELRRERGEAGRRHALRYHSYAGVGDALVALVDHAWRGTPLGPPFVDAARIATLNRATT